MNDTSYTAAENVELTDALHSDIGIFWENERVLVDFQHDAGLTGHALMQDSITSRCIGDIYPNPAHDFCSLYVPVSSPIDLDLLVVSVSGRIINRTHIATNHLSINILPYPSGTYYLILYNRNGEVIGRQILIKN